MKWISLKDKMPEDNQYALVIDKNREIWLARYYHMNIPDQKINKYLWEFKADNDNCCTCTWPNLEGITHWMPLPETPKE